MQKFLKKILIVFLMLVSINVKALECTKVYGPYVGKPSEEYNLLDKEDTKNETEYYDFISNDPDYVSEVTLYHYKRISDINFFEIKNSKFAKIISFKIYNQDKELNVSRSSSDDHVIYTFEESNPLDLKIELESSSNDTFVLYDIGKDNVQYGYGFIDVNGKTTKSLNNTGPEGNHFTSYSLYDKYISSNANILIGTEVKYKYVHKLYHSYKLECHEEETTKEEKTENQDETVKEKSIKNEKQIINNDPEIYQVPNTYKD